MEALAPDPTVKPRILGGNKPVSTVRMTGRWIDVSDGCDTVSLEVKEAQALRDWLNEVLPP